MDDLDLAQRLTLVDVYTWRQRGHVSAIATVGLLTASNAARLDLGLLRHCCSQVYQCAR